MNSGQNCRTVSEKFFSDIFLNGFAKEHRNEYLTFMRKYDIINICVTIRFGSISSAGQNIHFILYYKEILSEMGRLFGTDGARGIAITELTCETAMNIGRAAALVLTAETNHKPKIIIGKDTRISSDVLEAALAAGICSVGADAVLLGTVPTPAVAYLVSKYEADAGVMISASHNSMEFNGIKLFSGSGFKLSDEIENEIEALILDNPEKMTLASHGGVGRISVCDKAQWDYIRHVMKALDGDLHGLRVALDCANGSASATAERLFTGLGATIVLTNAEPDGTNINDRCGSTCLDSLCRCVKENKCALGLAFDGDADRCLAVDENGIPVDGDRMIAIFAKDMKQSGTLRGNTAVVTVMTNMGFLKFAENEGIGVVSAKVGDRYVLEQMQQGGFSIGGEQSGHIIFLDHATTGDGQLSGVKLMEVMAKSGKKLSELAAVMERYPQVLVNVKVTPEGRAGWKNDAEIAAAINAGNTELGSEGRILVRESGTEPLVRVMLEGKNFELINKIALDIAGLLKSKYRA